MKTATNIDRTDAGYTLAETLTTISLLLILAFIFSGFFYTLKKSVTQTNGTANEAFTVLRIDRELREHTAKIRVPYWERIPTNSLLAEYSESGGSSRAFNSGDGVEVLGAERWRNKGVVFRYRVGKTSQECKERFSFRPLKEEL
jgi:hypothetical protein